MDDSDDDAWSSSNEANLLMESGRNSYSASSRVKIESSLARGRLGGGHLFTKDTPVLGRRTPQFSAQQQPSPLATPSTGINGSSNYLAPPQPHYQQLPQVCFSASLKTSMSYFVVELSIVTFELFMFYTFSRH